MWFTITHKCSIPIYKLTFERIEGISTKTLYYKFTYFFKKTQATTRQEKKMVSISNKLALGAGTLLYLQIENDLFDHCILHWILEQLIKNSTHIQKYKYLTLLMH